MGTVLVAIVVIGALWLIATKFGGATTTLPQVKVPDLTTRQTTNNLGRGAGGGDNRAAVRDLGGKVDYGTIDPDTGQRSGIGATITPAMVKAAAGDRLGSEPLQTIRPPGYDQLPARNRSRGHLLGRQLGGSGDVAANLVALYQRRANSPAMRDYETEIANAVKAGETVTYKVKPIYASPTSKGAPVAVRLTAKGDRGFVLDVQIANTEAAVAKVFAGQATG
jgi:hypothetical protein